MQQSEGGHGEDGVGATETEKNEMRMTRLQGITFLDMIPNLRDPLAFEKGQHEHMIYRKDKSSPHGSIRAKSQR